MTPQELLDQAAERDAFKASERRERKAARETNAQFREQDAQPFGTLPRRKRAITTSPAPEPFDGLDAVAGDAA